MAQSFSAMVKEELVHLEDPPRHCAIAEAAAMLCMCGRLEGEDGSPRLELRTENNSTARKFFTLLKKTFNISSIMTARQLSNRKKNRSYVLTVEDTGSIQTLLQTCRLKVPGEGTAGLLQMRDGLLLERDCCRRAFLRGAFLASGSVSDPAKTYHFEIVCSGPSAAGLVCDVMERIGITARVVMRKQHEVVYVKDSSQLMDLLGLMGATDSMMQMQNVQILKSIRNQANRGVNCDTANIRKALAAANRQIEDIRLLQRAGLYEDLEAPLREIADLRVTYPEATLTELGEMLKEPVGKSGVNHRLKKIGRIAEKLQTGAGKAPQH